MSENVTILIVRRSGWRSSAPLMGYRVRETTVDCLCLVASERAAVSAETYGAVILEDLRREDIPAMAWRAISAGIREGVSCPVVTRWTNPSAGETL
ncbi:hypothetical protein [Methylobacterium sp. AMS5]|uniref:hypothetical protein n=1 Tax=Methylobacterium sp. AMS5 TaxID=925818 RepID=UPI00074F8CE2|nr:hypothetical protein [Methylobacterium sp. AMS5]AMB48279.1 hypothetical protein Y590_25260 [Methylobacterium sp. AMS5]